MRRRGVLGLLVLGGAASLAAACSPAAPAAQSRGTPGTAAQQGAKVALPTYVPFQGPPPDLPGSADGLTPPGYLNYPLNPVKSVQQPVGSGEEVTAVTYTTQ